MAHHLPHVLLPERHCRAARQGNGRRCSLSCCPAVYRFSGFIFVTEFCSRFFYFIIIIFFLGGGGGGGYFVTEFCSHSLPYCPAVNHSSVFISLLRFFPSRCLIVLLSIVFVVVVVVFCLFHY